MSKFVSLVTFSVGSVALVVSSLVLGMSAPLVVVLFMIYAVSYHSLAELVVFHKKKESSDG